MKKSMSSDEALGIGLIVWKGLVLASEKMCGSLLWSAMNFLGSLRRMKGTVGDLDMVFFFAGIDQMAKMPELVCQFASTSADFNLEMCGNRKARMMVLGKQVDLSFHLTKETGAALIHHTGPAEHNIALRQLAQDLGMSLNDKCITIDGEVRYFDLEIDVYMQLGLEYIPPQDRTGNLSLAGRGQS
ncbi:MAG: hypothetical protein ABIA75_13920 [Candidatus Neomarinimicrobiota bacterium]